MDWQPRIAHGKKKRVGWTIVSWIVTPRRKNSVPFWYQSHCFQPIPCASDLAFTHHFQLLQFSKCIPLAPYTPETDNVFETYSVLETPNSYTKLCNFCWIKTVNRRVWVILKQNRTALCILTSPTAKQNVSRSHIWGDSVHRAIRFLHRLCHKKSFGCLDIEHYLENSISTFPYNMISRYQSE